MERILIIDDDEAIGNLEQEVLERAGYHVLRAYSGTEALLLLNANCPDLILLDLMLPGLSGEEVLPWLQGIPVIVVSAKATVQDKVNLLLGGAADYLTKPFDTKELLARVAVRLREAARSPLAPVLSCGDLALDTASHTVQVGDKPVSLTRTEYAILMCIMIFSILYKFYLGNRIMPKFAEFQKILLTSGEKYCMNIRTMSGQGTLCPGVFCRS